LTDPATSHSEESTDSSGLRFFKVKNYFDYIYAPGNEYQGARFQAAMAHWGSIESSTAVPGGFPWETLPEGMRIVDVGGGTGSACRDIMETNPLLKFTVQDLPRVCEQAVAYWNQYDAKAIPESRVTIQAHDIFAPQPVKDADIFVLRYVLHDWADSNAIKILQRLREVAIPGKTRVIVIEGVTQYACAIDRKQISGAEDIVFEESGKSDVPVGLLPNFGRATARNYLLDLMMLTKHNGQERTLGDHIRIMEASGWKIKKVYSSQGRRANHLLAEAV